MADQLKKLKRRQLLELMVAQGKELETAREQLKAAQERLAELESKLAQMTAAGLESAGIIEHAKREAEAYEKARRAEAERQAEQILAQARQGAGGQPAAPEGEGGPAAIGKS